MRGEEGKADSGDSNEQLEKLVHSKFRDIFFKKNLSPALIFTASRMNVQNLIRKGFSRWFRAGSFLQSLSAGSHKADSPSFLIS